MIEALMSTYRRLLSSITYTTYRSLFHTFNIENRLTGLIGPRGTGKTTMLLQFIKGRMDEQDRCFYVSLDNIFFARQSLLEFVNELYEIHGIRYFFLDEVHKYPNWDQELKNIYDSYPDVKVVFSGSSSIDLIKGTYDLSRRGVIYRISGLSFREYLHFRGVVTKEPFEYEALLSKRSMYEQELGGTDMIRGYFKQYLRNGYYPFFMEDEKTYQQKLFQIIEKTVFEDISNYYRLKTENLVYFKRILSYIATIPPGELNRNSIAKTIQLDYKTVQTYLHILEETGLVSLLSSNQGGSAVLKAREKVYLENSNLYAAIAGQTGHEVNEGSIREIFFVSMLRNAGKHVFYSTTGDFEVEGTIFEVGGRNKGIKQIKAHLGNAFLVKDDILYGNRYEIPLYLFGFLY